MICWGNLLICTPATSSTTEVHHFDHHHHLWINIINLCHIPLQVRLPTSKCSLGKHSLKKTEFYEKNSQKGGGGQPDFIFLIQKCYAPKKARENQNKDFIKAVRGGGVTFLWKFFIYPEVHTLCDAVQRNVLFKKEHHHLPWKI